MLKPYCVESSFEAGVDEAGRGCLAGPVTAAAVIFPEGFSEPLLDDSKKLDGKKRFYLRQIVERDALAYAVAHVPPEIIDEINILNATFEAMHLAIDKLGIKPRAIAVDGNRFKAYENIPHRCIVKGDSKYQHIAAASILAKTYRDEFMLGYSEKYPGYLWEKNKGYPTLSHRNAIAKLGITPLHRKSFRLLPQHMEFDFKTQGYEKKTHL